MIDLAQYRAKIGTYTGVGNREVKKGNSQTGNFCGQEGIFYSQYFCSNNEKDSKFPDIFQNNNNGNAAYNIMYLLYLYFILVVCTLTMLITLSTDTSSISI